MAKQLVPVANKPVLYYGLAALRDAGITEVGIIVGHRAAEIRQAVDSLSDLGLNVTYIPQETPLGLAHCVLIAREFLGEDDFVMYLGDNVILDGVGGIVADFRRRRPAAQILLAGVPDPQRYGIAEVDAEGRVSRLVEKPAAPRSDLAVIGLYVFSPAIHEAVRAIPASERGELEITDAIQWLIDRGRTVDSHLFGGYWRDTGEVEDLLECNRRLLELVEPAVHGKVDSASELIGRVVVERDAEVSGSRLVGPVVIGPGARISGSYVGPFTSVGADCQVSDSSLDYSILLDGSVIADVRGLHGSVLGRQTIVSAPQSVVDANRFVIGDHSRLQIGSLR
jgi:glucose-1-phosphate thymidylyltransferase